MVEIKVMTKEMLQAFNKRKKKLLLTSLFSLGITFLSVAIVGLKLFYPFHMVAGIFLYVFSFVPITWRIYLSRDTWRKYHAYKSTKSFFKKEIKRFVLVLCLLIAVFIFFWLRPMDEKPFDGLSNTEITQRVANDLYTSVSALDYLETTGNELLEILAREEENANTTEQITLSFEEFLRAVSYSESLTEVHRYFASIPYRLWDERVTSFLMSYSLYVKKYEIIFRIMDGVSGSEYKKKVLNQHSEYADRENVYNEMVTRFYTPKTKLRLTGGYFYMKLFVRTDKKNGDSYMLLRDKAMESYRYLKNNFGNTVLKSGEVFVDSTEINMFDTWFPIQKNIANTMGHVILSTRGKEGLISKEQSLEMEQSMQPGDIMLQRRNWHVSNVGIPGFWTHSALYTGSLDTMDIFFATEFPYAGYDSMSVYLKGELPEVFTRFNERDSAGDTMAVIEAIEPGVVLQSFPVSTNADFVVALRPQLTKRDILFALLKAFENLGKPYDYNFDFDTRDALVCSELVYDAYFEKLPEKNGLHFKTSVVNGRKIVSPFDMANKFVDERWNEKPELRFVYFLRSEEDTGKVRQGSELEFLESIEWSKFSFLQ